MPKYNCKVTATVEYEIVVEADSEDEAAELACASVDASHVVDARDFDCWDIHEVK